MLFEIDNKILTFASIRIVKNYDRDLKKNLYKMQNKN